MNLCIVLQVFQYCPCNLRLRPVKEFIKREAQLWWNVRAMNIPSHIYLKHWGDAWSSSYHSKCSDLSRLIFETPLEEWKQYFYVNKGEQVRNETNELRILKISWCTTPLVEQWSGDLFLLDQSSQDKDIYFSARVVQSWYHAEFLKIILLIIFPFDLSSLWT